MATRRKSGEVRLKEIQEKANERKREKVSDPAADRKSKEWKNTVRKRK